MIIADKKNSLSCPTGGRCSHFCSFIALAAIPIEHWTQASGAQVYLVQSPAIPMVDVQLDFDAGSRRDPPEQAGLASVTAGMLEKGVLANNGAAALDENALGEAWADLGAQFGASASADRMSFSLRSLDLPRLARQGRGVWPRGKWPSRHSPAIWQRERQRVQAALKEANTRPAR